MSNKKIAAIYTAGIVILTPILMALLFAIFPVNDPALPEIVYDRHGNAYTQQGEPVDCEVDTRC